jgi:methylated-DNA-protein-cysteine methyltransferase-like protein
MTNSYDMIHAMVARIPAGQVATYGQIARLINRPRWARQVGYALAALASDSTVPWHRVVNARGEISLSSEGGRHEYQRALLEDEGIIFDERGRIDLSRYLWRQPMQRGPLD